LSGLCLPVLTLGLDLLRRLRLKAFQFLGHALIGLYLPALAFSLQPLLGLRLQPFKLHRHALIGLRQPTLTLRLHAPLRLGLPAVALCRDPLLGARFGLGDEMTVTLRKVIFVLAGTLPIRLALGSRVRETLG